MILKLNSESHSTSLVAHNGLSEGLTEALNARYFSNSCIIRNATFFDLYRFRQQTRNLHVDEDVFIKQYSKRKRARLNGLVKAMYGIDDPARVVSVLGEAIYNFDHDLHFVITKLLPQIEEDFPKPLLQLLVIYLNFFNMKSIDGRLADYSDAGLNLTKNERQLLRIQISYLAQETMASYSPEQAYEIMDVLKSYDLDEFLLTVASNRRECFIPDEFLNLVADWQNGKPLNEHVSENNDEPKAPENIAQPKSSIDEDLNDYTIHVNKGNIPDIETFKGLPQELKDKITPVDDITDEGDGQDMLARVGQRSLIDPGKQREPEFRGLRAWLLMKEIGIGVENVINVFEMDESKFIFDMRTETGGRTQIYIQDYHDIFFIKTSISKVSAIFHCFVPRRRGTQAEREQDEIDGTLYLNQRRDVWSFKYHNDDYLRDKLSLFECPLRI